MPCSKDYLFCHSNLGHAPSLSSFYTTMQFRCGRTQCEWNPYQWIKVSLPFLPTIIYRGDNYYELIYNLTLTIAFLIPNSALSLCISHVGFSSCSYLLIPAFLYCFAYLLQFLPRKTSPEKLPSTSLHLQMMPSANLSALIMAANMSGTMSEAHNRGS